MGIVHVQFSGSDEQKVVSAFSCEQDADVFPNQGEIEDTDPRYLAFISPASTLDGAKAAQIATAYASYQATACLDVTYTSVAGVRQTFQADADSQQTLLIATTGYNMAGKSPDGFYWVASDNTKVPFTLDDLKGLYAVMLGQGQGAFDKLQGIKAAIRAATTIQAVQAITWG